MFDLEWREEFDGLGRTTKSYVTDGGGDTTYSDAGNVTGDAVLSQSELTYDIGGRTLKMTNRERFHDETGTGALGTPMTCSVATKARAVPRLHRRDPARDRPRRARRRSLFL